MRSADKEEVVITNVAFNASQTLRAHPSAPHPFAAGPVRPNTSRLLEPFPTSLTTLNILHASRSSM